MASQIIRVGNSLAVEIPEEVAAQASLTAGNTVEWIANGSGSIALVCSPRTPSGKNPADMTLDELLEGLNDGDTIGEYDWGPPRGVEVW